LIVALARAHNRAPCRSVQAARKGGLFLRQYGYAQLHDQTCSTKDFEAMKTAVIASTQSHTQPMKAWSNYCLKASQLFGSSSEVIARRGLLYAFPGTANVLAPEFDRMVSEKSAAATEMWTAMFTKSTQLAPTLVWKLWANLFIPRSPIASTASVQSTHTALGNATLNVIKTGMRPVQRRVTANAKRLKSRKK